MQLDGLTLFGLLSLSAMLVFYALEHRSHWFVLAFAGGVHRRVSLWLPSGRLALWRCRVDLGGRRVQAVAIAAASVIAGLRLRKQRELLEPERLVEAVHQVEVLQGLAG